MLLKQETLRGIESGSITVAFRKWRRPTVKAGGTLVTSVGQLSINAVEVVSLEAITTSEALAAGFSSLESLRSQFLRRADGEVYRVRLAMAGPDPRVALRGEIPDAAELGSILERLARLDSRSRSGTWTGRVLTLLRERPEERTGDLAEGIGMDKAGFKVNVRQRRRAPPP
jgi:hypothetical protein